MNAAYLHQLAAEAARPDSTSKATRAARDLLVAECLKLAPAPATVLTLPYPPSVNTYWRNLNGRTVTSAKGRQYRADVYAVPDVHRVRFGDARLRVVVTLHRADRRRYDVDNFCKGLLDALTNAGVWDDDSQIDDLRVIRGDVRPGGCAVVEIVKSDMGAEP